MIKVKKHGLAVQQIHLTPAIPDKDNLKWLDLLGYYPFTVQILGHCLNDKDEVASATFDYKFEIACHIESGVIKVKANSNNGYVNEDDISDYSLVNNEDVREEMLREADKITHVLDHIGMSITCYDEK